MKTIISCCLVIFCLEVNSQTIKREEIHYADSKIETKDLRIVLVDGVSQENDFVKAKVKITNKSNYPVLAKLEESSFTNNNGAVFYSSLKKWLLIVPNSVDTKVIKASAMGEKINTGKVFFNLDGLYACQELTQISIPIMPLKAEKEVVSGKFKCTIVDVDWNDGLCVVKYKIKYFGEKVGAFFPEKVSIQSDNGEQSFHKGKHDEIGVVFTLKNGEEVYDNFRFNPSSNKKNVLLWNDAVMEYAATKKLEKHTVELITDTLKTDRSNKSLIKVIKEFNK